MATKMATFPQNLKQECPDSWFSDAKIELRGDSHTTWRELLLSAEERIRRLIEKSELDMEIDERKKGTLKLFQALKMAKQTRNKAFVKKISQKLSDAWMQGESGYYFLNPISMELKSIETDGLVLDIGGGGEGIIGKLNGTQVVAIDTSERANGNAE